MSGAVFSHVNVVGAVCSHVNVVGAICSHVNVVVAICSHVNVVGTVCSHVNVVLLLLYFHPAMEHRPSINSCQVCLPLAVPSMSYPSMHRVILSAQEGHPVILVDLSFSFFSRRDHGWLDILA